MKNKLISTMVIGILTASILNTPTLAKYIESFKPLKETIVAYEMQKTDVHIQHINKSTNEIIEQEVLNDIEIDTVLVSNEYKKDILGYEYDSVESEIVQVSENNNIIKIYYNPITIEENKFDVSINYYEKDTSNKLIESKVLSSQEEGTIINSMDYQVDIDGYVFDSVDKEELIVDKDNTSINFYYKKDNNLPDEITYDVSLVYVDEDNNEIHEREVLPSILENSTIDSSKYILNIEGYEFVKSNPETLIVDKDNNKIVYQYKKIPEVEKYNVTINYYLKDTDNKIRDSIILKDLEKGTMLNSKDYIVKIDGYEYASSNVETVEVIKDEVINLYYIEKEIPVEHSDVTIYHRDIESNKEISEKDVIKDIEHGTYVLGIDYIKNIQGYKFVKASPEFIKVDKENNSIVIYYEKEIPSNGGGSVIPPQEEIKFNDIKGHWAEKTIELFMKKGYISGYEDNTFKPDNGMTRAEFVKVVNKVFGYTQKGIEQFLDVNKDDWFYEDICIGIKEGYIKGKSTDIFAPNDKITRQEATMILTNIMNNKDENLDKLNTFKDGDKTAKWAQSSMEGAIEAGYLNGYEDKTIRANGNITRAEAITMLSRVKK